MASGTESRVRCLGATCILALVCTEEREEVDANGEAGWISFDTTDILEASSGQFSLGDNTNGHQTSEESVLSHGSEAKL